MTYVRHNTYQAKDNHHIRPARPVEAAKVNKTPVSHKQRIWNELKSLGMSKWGLLKLETRYLPKLIHEDEPVKAVVYGHNDTGSAMLVATDRRVIFVDRKPLFTRADEITYDVVAGVTYGQVAHRATISLHTRIGDYVIHTVNVACAEHFRDYVERFCLDHILPNPEVNA